MNIKILRMLALAMVSGCLGLETKEKVTGNFYLVAADDNSQMNLSYSDSADRSIYVNVINATVFAVGYNKNYIIAKQHPANKTITNYYILPITGLVTYNTLKNLIGPMNEAEFNKKIKTLLGAENLTFTKGFSQLK